MYIWLLCTTPNQCTWACIIRVFLELQEFFEEDEYWNTSTPVQSSSIVSNETLESSKTLRTPLIQMCNQASLSGDKYSLPVTSSSQRLKTFSFIRSSRKDVTVDSDNQLPPSKRPALEENKFTSRLSCSQMHTSSDTSKHCSIRTTPNRDTSTDTTTNPVSRGIVVNCSTPITTVNNKYNGATPNRRSVVKRKFPGPAGVLPKLVRKSHVTIAFYMHT